MYGLGGKEYIYHHTEDESTFQLVDTSRLQRPMHQKSRPKINHVRRVLNMGVVLYYKLYLTSTAKDQEGQREERGEEDGGEATSSQRKTQREVSVCRCVCMDASRIYISFSL